MENNLIDEWITNFEKTDNLYQKYYKDDIYYINICVIYINKENEIEDVKTNIFFLSDPNVLLRRELIEILKSVIINNKIRYSLFSILKYNITLNTDEVQIFLTDESNYDYASVVKNIDDIYFDKTINMFQDINSITLILNEKTLCETSSNALTKKLYYNNNTNKYKKTRKNIETKFLYST
jgi:hypothetical protein